MKYYCFQYLTIDDQEIIIRTKSKEKTNRVAKYIQFWFEPNNCGGYFYEEEDEGSLEKER